VRKWVDVGVGGASATVGVFAVFAGGALCLAPTGISQLAGGAMIAAGIGAITFGTAKSIDAMAALASDKPTHDIPSSYGDLLGTETDKAMGGDGVVGGIVGSLLEGGLTAGVLKAATKGSTDAAVQLLPVVESGIASVGVGLSGVELATTVTPFLLQEKQKSSGAKPSTHSGTLSTGGGGGNLPAAVKRDVD